MPRSTASRSPSSPPVVPRSPSTEARNAGPRSGRAGRAGDALSPAPGYRYDLPPEKLAATFTADSRLVLTTADVPTETYNAPIVGEASIHTLADLRSSREQEIDFRVAQLPARSFFRDDEGNLKPWLFPQLLRITQTVAAGMPELQGRHLPADAALDSSSRSTRRTNLPLDRCCDCRRKDAEADPISIRHRRQHRFVDFDTSRAVYPTTRTSATFRTWWPTPIPGSRKPRKPWRAWTKWRYFKNHNVGFTIPYTTERPAAELHAGFRGVPPDAPPASRI